MPPSFGGEVVRELRTDVDQRMLHVGEQAQVSWCVWRYRDGVRVTSLDPASRQTRSSRPSPRYSANESQSAVGAESDFRVAKRTGRTNRFCLAKTGSAVSRCGSMPVGAGVSWGSSAVLKPLRFSKYPGLGSIAQSVCSVITNRTVGSWLSKLVDRHGDGSRHPARNSPRAVPASTS